MLAQQQQQQQQQQMMQQQQMQMEQQRQQEEFMRQQMLQQQQQQSLIPQHTSVGSNNPFAPRPAQQSLLDPSPGQQQQNNNNSLFSNSFLPVPSVQTNNLSPSQSSPSPATPTPASPAKPAWQQPVKKDDGAHADLANLIGRGREDGIDTFGNIGNLREWLRDVWRQRRCCAVRHVMCLELLGLPHFAASIPQFRS